MNEKQRCEGITRAGAQCKRRAAPQSDFCRQHDGSGQAGGAPPGNVNARKHGLYADLFADDELEALARFGAAEGLADEIALLRSRIYRAVKEGGAELDAIGRACGRLTQMLKAQRVLTGEAASEFERAMAEVLDGLVEELGLSLG